MAGSVLTCNVEWSRDKRNMMSKYWQYRARLSPQNKVSPFDSLLRLVIKGMVRALREGWRSSFSLYQVYVCFIPKAFRISSNIYDFCCWITLHKWESFIFMKGKALTRFYGRHSWFSRISFLLEYKRAVLEVVESRNKKLQLWWNAELSPISVQ